jgi:hypothetical protein
MELKMLAVAQSNSFNRSFENVESTVKLNDDRMFAAQIGIAPGQCLEVSQEEGREETCSLAKISSIRQGDYRIFNKSKEALSLWCCSTPAEKFSEDTYIRRKEDCFKIETGNKENIRELFGVYDNGPSTSHSVAINEIRIRNRSKQKEWALEFNRI